MSDLSLPANDLDADFAVRARGAYLGLAIGDALGATVEFLTAGEIARQYGEHRNIVGGGWLKLRPGQITDDTEMSLAMGEAIVEAGDWDLARIAANWTEWLKGKPIDVGNTCRRGLQRVIRDGSLQGPPHDGDAGNGACMRLLPAVLYAGGNDARLARCLLEQARVTHHHPLSDAACLCVGRIAGALLAGASLADVRPFADALVAEHRNFRFDPYPRRATGYVVDTVQTVFHALFSTDSFEACLIRTVNYGGDADTTGAIAGMLAGAAYGEASLPLRWRRRLDPDVTRRIGEQCRALPSLATATPPATLRR